MGIYWYVLVCMGMYKYLWYVLVCEYVMVCMGIYGMGKCGYV